MKILFLDQSGQLGGAELSLADVAYPYRENCLVGLFADGAFRQLLEEKKIPVQILTNQSINVKKDSGILKSLGSFGSIAPLVFNVANLAQKYDIIYANTQKALVIGALASFLSRKPLVYHLRDILNADHFSRTNRRIAVSLANRFASLVIANSEATRNAFLKSRGRLEIAQVVYNGFQPEKYEADTSEVHHLREQLKLEGKFVVGHFSRLSPWKGQHILLDALTSCPDDVMVLLVGDALFGEQDYVKELHQQVADLGLENRVKFLGFRSDIVPLMTACNLVAHTSTSPEPFGRVIIEAMMCQTPVVGAAAGGVVELINPGKTGWLVTPGNSQEVANVINGCYQNPELAATVAAQAYQKAIENFQLEQTQQQIDRLLHQLL
ncbi:MAG: glycosyltransferase [Cyanobacteriota bacterium]|nr:glycosyltransferase [Cyanobacteriota bacterium]